MPTTKPHPSAPYISIAEAAERSGLTHQGIHYLVAQRANGPFPGACQLTREANSPWLIPAAEFEDWLKAREQ
jgi:hypothetical protein